jgi:hypothetical protein
VNPQRCERCEYAKALRRGRCDACSTYLARTGRERPWMLIARAIGREIERGFQ